MAIERAIFEIYQRAVAKDDPKQIGLIQGLLGSYREHVNQGLIDPPDVNVAVNPLVQRVRSRVEGIIRARRESLNASLALSINHVGGALSDRTAMSILYQATSSQYTADISPEILADRQLAAWHTTIRALTPWQRMPITALIGTFSNRGYPTLGAVRNEDVAILAKVPGVSIKGLEFTLIAFDRTTAEITDLSKPVPASLSEEEDKAQEEAEKQARIETMKAVILIEPAMRNMKGYEALLKEILRPAIHFWQDNQHFQGIAGMVDSLLISGRLSEREIRIIILRYALEEPNSKPRSDRQLAADFGVEQTRIKSIQQKAIRKFKKLPNLDLLQSQLPT